MKSNTENSNANNKRSSKISTYKRKNLLLSKQIREYIKKTKLNEDTTNNLMKLTEKLIKCAHISLYRMEGNEKNNVKYINSHTCKNRICNVCNFKRLKQIRQKYLKFFQENESLAILEPVKNQKNKTLKVLTISQAGLCKWVSENIYKENDYVSYCNHTYQSTVSENKNINPLDLNAWKICPTDQALKEIYKRNKKFSFVGLREYDLMHLTLTVRHEKETGWNGEPYYFQQFGKLLKQLRNMPFWKEMVYGGEFGIEVTNYDGRTSIGIDGKSYKRKDSGLHIHVHSLILVKKGLGNRNKLHREIMIAWNRISVNEKSEDREFKFENIKKGNSLITDEDIKQFHPKGATMIGLNNIYYTENNKQKFINQKDFKEKGEGFCRAILETIKYHFEPVCFSKDNETFDIDLIAKIIPKIHNLRFHERFGCLRGIRELSFKENKEDLMKELSDNAQEQAEEGAEFFIIPAQKIIHDWKKDNKIIIPNHVMNKAIKLDVSTTPAAIMRMSDMVQVLSRQKSKNQLDGEKERKIR